MAWYSKFYDETGLIEVGGVQLPARSWFGDTPDAELKQYADSVERLEASGELDNLFKGPCADPAGDIGDQKTGRNSDSLLRRCATER